MFQTSARRVHPPVEDPSKVAVKPQAWAPLPPTFPATHQTAKSKMSLTIL